MPPEKEIEARELELLTSRVSGGLLVWLAAAAVFVLVDFVLGNDPGPIIEWARASNVLALFAYLYLRRPRERWQIEGVAVAVMVQGTMVLSLCVALLPDPVAALTLFCVMLLGAATVLPWRFGCQVVVATAAAVGLALATVWSSADVAELFTAPMLGVFICFGVSVYIAHVLEVQRQATNRALAAIQNEARVSNALARVGRELIHSLDEPALLQRLCALTSETLECDSSYTFLTNKKGKLVAAAGHGCRSDEWAELCRMRFGRTEVEPLLARLGAAGFSHAAGEHGWSPIASAVNPHDPMTLVIYFALRKGSDLVGFQAAAFRGRQSAPTFYESRLVRGLSDLASLALETARLVEELAGANRVQNDFLANMSHELRTPLNVIIGYCEMLEDAAFGSVNPDQAATIEHVRNAAEGQLALISATLQLSGMDSGDGALETFDIDSESFLAELRRESELVVRGKGLEFVCRAESEVPSIRTDSVKLKMIIKNLIDNAAKFTERGSVELSAVLAAEGARFVVEDTGPGIPPEARGAIFEAFRQHTTKETQGRGGVGIGLYIVKRLVDALGGQVDLSSEIGRGTRFEVSVPNLAEDGNPELRESA